MTFLKDSSRERKTVHVNNKRTLFLFYLFLPWPPFDKNNNDDEDDDEDDNSDFINVSRKIAEDNPVANRGPLKYLKY